MTLDNIDTNGFLEDPKNPDFEDRMIARSPVFDVKIDKVNRRKLLTYMTLVYDKKSYYRRDVKQYSRRKKEAGVCAGFSVRDDGKFSSEVEKCLVGESEDFNKSVIQYVSWMYDNDYKQLVILEFNYNKLMLLSMTSWDEKANKLIEDMRIKIEEREQSIFGGNETKDVRKALYEGTEQTRLKLRPEAVVDKFELDGLMDWSPYGRGYKPSDIKFVGETPQKS